MKQFGRKEIAGASVCVDGYLGKFRQLGKKAWLFARCFYASRQDLDRPSVDLNASDGDSGSLWLSDPGTNVIALHIGGDSGRAIATPIGAVTAAFAAESLSLGL